MWRRLEALRIVSFLGGIAAVGDDRQNTLILDPLAHILADVGFVSGNSERRPATYKGMVMRDKAEMALLFFALVQDRLVYVAAHDCRQKRRRKFDCRFLHVLRFAL